MKGKMDLHDYQGQLDRILVRIDEEKKISQKNKEFILGFKDYLLSEGIGVARIGRYLIDLRKFAFMLNKQFDKANEKDIRAVIGKLEQTDLAPESKKCFKIMLRKLYRFIRGVSEKRVYPKEVSWISINIPRSQSKLPEELLTEEEVKKIISACENPRDRAMIACLAESGCRVSEIGLMKIKNVSFEEYGARLTVNGKTGMRKILIINSMPYLQEWINLHPKNNDPESFLWYNKQDKSFLCYKRIAVILKSAVKVAGIKKRVHLHLLRHSRATQLASTLSDAQLKNYLGWAQSSKMASIYIHMSGKDTDEAILKISGIEVKKEIQISQLKPHVCIRCKTSNSATNKFCKLCGFVLDEEEAKNIFKKETESKDLDQIMNSLLKDNDILEIIAEKIQGTNLAQN